jgi:uncharacterized protein
LEYVKELATEFKWQSKYMENIVALLDEGNTIPFIARYRKEATGSMDETMLRDIEARLAYLRSLAKRKEEVSRLIEEQGKLTAELAQEIAAAKVLQQIEDLYLPFRQKRRTRATIAKEKGLEPLAQEILTSGDATFCLTFGDATFLQKYSEEDLAGAGDIICEYIQDHAGVRGLLRDFYQKEGLVTSKNLTDESTVYDIYYDYKEPVAKILPHRIMALNRGEKEEILQVKIEVDENKAQDMIYKTFFLKNPDYKTAGREEFFAALVADSFKRLLQPSLERESRNSLTEKAQEQAIKVFAQNLDSLLMQSPVKKKAILGLDPGFRTGCKLAVINDLGQVLDKDVIFPHPPQSREKEARAKLLQLINKWGVDLVVIGNGTASRESEQLVASLINEEKPGLSFVIASEAGASVYSASKLAKEEFPDYDVSERSAVSIARRILDPLAELVKIEPRSIGVGQYQHDLPGKELDASLKDVVESCVNRTGVEINTASASLLQYVAGLNKTIAGNIIKYRDENHGIKNRQELLKVPRLGAKAFEQAAGFIRIREGDNPLENTSVHPESYRIALDLLEKLGFQAADLRDEERQKNLALKLKNLDQKEMAQELESGQATLKDIIDDLIKPGRDPREDLVKPLLRSDVLKLEDLKPGMVLEGTITNVVDFGAFIDIGLKNDGLAHISQLADKFIKHPLEVVSVGNIVKAKVLEADQARGRVSLTLKI